MALRLAKTSNGITLPAAYARVARFTFSGKTTVRGHVDVFANAAAAADADAPAAPGPGRGNRTARVRPVDGDEIDFVYDLTPGAGNLYQQAYAALKATSAYASAADV